jgi:hypothetical protein
MKRAFKKNLKFRRRWAILIDGYIDGDIKVSELDLGVLLICGLSVKNKMLSHTLSRKIWTDEDAVTIQERSTRICNHYSSLSVNRISRSRSQAKQACGAWCTNSRSRTSWSAESIVNQGRESDAAAEGC